MPPCRVTHSAGRPAASVVGASGAGTTDEDIESRCCDSSVAIGRVAFVAVGSGSAVTVATNLKPRRGTVWM